jgi:hypothetical protein
MTMKHLRFLMVAALSLSTFMVQAWDGKAHAEIAALAQANLTAAAEAQVDDLLRDDLDRYEEPSGRKTLAAVASWPDEIRDEAVKTDPKAYKGWHVRGNQVCGDRLAACHGGHCVDQLIIYYAKVLQDRKQDHRTRNEALKWVVHLIGDLHQPLHSGINANGGGAKVVMDGVELKPTATFHSVWDTELANAALKNWKPQISLPADLNPLPEDAPTQWMMETREVALHEVYEPLHGFNCSGKLPEPFVLDEAYQQHSIAVVRQQIERAALRLAQLLNQLLS